MSTLGCSSTEYSRRRFPPPPSVPSPDRHLQSFFEQAPWVVRGWLKESSVGDLPRLRLFCSALNNLPHIATRSSEFLSLRVALICNSHLCWANYEFGITLLVRTLNKVGLQQHKRPSLLRHPHSRVHIRSFLTQPSLAAL